MSAARSAATAVVAIDGPSGSGKSSVSRGVARSLGLHYLDTGAMYRAVTWAVLRDGAEDPAARLATAHALDLEFSLDPDETWIRVDGVDVSRAIREQVVTSAVSQVAAEPLTRACLVQLQRDAVDRARADGCGIVIEGRDIGSVVVPDADLKVWLVADQKVRAARRAAEDVAAGRAPAATGAGIAAASIATDLARRDAADAGRSASPAAPAPDAVVVDATEMSLAEVIDTVVGLVRQRTTS